jgi:ribosomal protein S18 acetylase RimI-like enzyme
MTYRFAKSEDCSVLAELNHQLIQDEGHRNTMTIDELKQRMSGWLKDEYISILFEENSKILAYALYREGLDEIYLRQLFVQRTHRRHGVGKKVMEILTSNIWPRNKRLTVEVLTSNHAALAFWRSVGYMDYSLTLEIQPSKR